MIEEELEQKAEERCNKLSEENCEYKTFWKNGYEQGQKDIVENNFDEEMFSKAVEIANEYDNIKKENEELKAQIEKMNTIMTSVFEDIEADMCSTESEVLFDYLKRFLKKYEVIV